MAILYAHPESGHTCKVALALELAGIPPATLDPAREWLFWEANRIGISLPNLRHYLRFDDSPAPPAGVLDWLRGRLQSDLQRLEKELSGNTWLLRAAPSVADIACFAYLCYDDIGLDLGAFPGLRGWMSWLRALPRWRPPHDLLARPA